MASFSNITILGRLTRDPELRKAGEKDVASFTVAVNGKRTKNKEMKSEFFSVNVWNSSVNACMQYLTKGSEVLVNGSISTREYESKNGEKRTSMVIDASNVVFTSKPAGESAQKSSQEEPVYTPAVDEELPF